MGNPSLDISRTVYESLTSKSLFKHRAVQRHISQLQHLLIDHLHLVSNIRNSTDAVDMGYGDDLERLSETLAGFGASLSKVYKHTYSDSSHAAELMREWESDGRLGLSG